MKWFEKFSLKNLLYKKKFVVSFSIVAAFIFWLVIVLVQNPEREQVFSDLPVTINVKGTVLESLGMDVIGGDIDKRVSVTVTGSNYIVSALRADDIVVTASLAEVTAPGTYTIPLTAARNSLTSGYTFVGLSPSSLTLTFDYIDTQDFSVTPIAEGVSAVSGLIAESPVISNLEDTVVTVKGARSDMAKIDRIAALATVDQTLEATTTFDAEIQLLDANGEQIEKDPFTISADSIKISVPISKKAEFQLVPSFINSPSADLAASLHYSVEPSTVTVIGPPETVDSMSSVSLSSIDFSEVSSQSSSFDVSLVLPDGVRILDNIEYATVSINTSAFAEKTFTVSNISFTNRSQDIQSVVSNSLRNVKICGPAADIARLTEADLIAVVDVKGKSAGEYTMDATVKSEKYPNVWQVGKYTVSVELK